MPDPSPLPAFPCLAVPSDPAQALLLGLYPQPQEGLWMQRVRVPGGRPSPAQWLVLGMVAEAYTPKTPLHLTTRQDVELHDLKAEALPAVQAALEQVDLTAVGACGDTVRNITVCPCSGAAAGAPDLMPLAEQIAAAVGTVEGVYCLPREFKIALSVAAEKGCPDRPYVNDLAFVAYPGDGGAWRLRAIAAGSMGPQPMTGMVAFESLDPADALPLALTAVKLLSRQGNRQDRSHGRLRHIRQRVGDDRFGQLLKDLFERERAARKDWPEVKLVPPDPPRAGLAVLTFPNGDVSPEQANALGKLAGNPTFPVRIGLDHRAYVYGPDQPAVMEAVTMRAPLAAAAHPQPNVVACPGAAWCKRAVCQTRALADRIRADCGRDIPPDMTVCLSGCPNGCGHSAVADVGIVGASRAGGRETFDLLAGGGMGRTPRLAQLIAKAVPADQLLRQIPQAIRACGKQ